jgi:Amidohydrolase
VRRGLLAAGVVLVLSRAPLSADRFDDAYKEAQAKLTSPEGRAYADRVAARFDEKKLRDALMDCAETLPPEDAPPFTVLMELTADGRPNQVLLRPPAPVAVCLRWIIRESSFPRPPAPGYWVAVDLSTTRAVGAPVIPTAGVATATVPPTRTPAAPPAPPPAPPVPTPTPATPPQRAAGAFAAEGIHVDARKPDLAALRRTLAASPASGIGPLLAQSDGMAADDPRLEPYWSLGEELDRPVAIALGPESPGSSSHAYRVALGDPLKLESVLARHPKLRIVVVGAGWPFGDAMAGLMRRYPQVSVDIRPLARILPDAEVQAYVRRLADAGLGARILNPTQ